MRIISDWMIGENLAHKSKKEVKGHTVLGDHLMFTIYSCSILTITGTIAQQNYEFVMKGITCEVRGVIVSLSF